MYKKYAEAWQPHRDAYGPRTALLYQVGGFYELYDTENLTTGTTATNVREIAEICQLSLTAKPVDATTQTLFGGFPVDALPKYERILVAAGWTVVIVEQRKVGAKVEDRVVDHVSSPGCFDDGGSGATRERRLVGCVAETMGGPAALQRAYWGVVALDLATGALWYTEGTARDRLHQFLCMHPPSELVIWSDGGAGAAALTESLSGQCSATHVRCLAPASVAVDESVLARQWTAKQCVLHPHARRCLAALLTFAADHLPSAIRCLKEPEAWIPDGEVRLGNAALEQLGVVGERGLLTLIDCCRSAAGRRLMRARLLRPVTDVAELERRLDLVAAVGKRDPATTERGLRSLYDMSRLWRRLVLGTATMNDMACLLRSYASAATLGCPHTEFLDWIGAEWKVEVCVGLDRGAPMTEMPFRCGGTVAALHAEGQRIRAEAVALCEMWSGLPVGKGKKENLYLDDAEGGGFRITGTKRRISSALTWLRDSGDGSARVTAYKTSAMLETAGLDDVSARHRAWMLRWTPVWADAWSAAIAAVVTQGSAAAGAIEAWCAELDLSWTVGRIAAEWRWVRPEFGTEAESRIEVDGLRHPILERITVPYVSHTMALGSAGSAAASESGILLYGMNASGKSSLMKATGLCVLMAQAGFPVPATACRLTPFTAIFTRILGNDNLWAGLSSFAVEMTEFREILRHADERSLVLGDELCSGTESLSATALVAAGVETLVRRRAKFVFATHLHELAALPDIAGLAGVRAFHLKVHYDAATDVLVYDRTLAPGSGSALYGLEVCRALDLPTDFLDRATAIRRALGGAVTAHRSVYAAGAVVDACAVCGGAERLEMHHIVAQAEGGGDEVGNLVCLCARCHDDHHGGRLDIRGWEETSAGRRLLFTRETGGIASEVAAWVREQRALRISVTVIQRMARQIHGVELTAKEVRTIK
jgi:DNA mismatch repair protein MutS